MGGAGGATTLYTFNNPSIPVLQNEIDGNIATPLNAVSVSDILSNITTSEFESAYFENAHFENEYFESTSESENAVFMSAPEFENAGFVSAPEFENAGFVSAPESENAVFMSAPEFESSSGFTSSNMNYQACASNSGSDGIDMTKYIIWA
jgi:hypothetical protein